MIINLVKLIMRFAFYAAAAIAACGANAANLQDLLDDDFTLIQIAEHVAALPADEMDTLSQLITEVEDRDFTAEEGNLAQTILEGNLLQSDLDTIANYIVHLREDQIHHIAERVKEGEQPMVMKALQDAGANIVKLGGSDGPGPAMQGREIIRPIAARPMGH